MSGAPGSPGAPGGPSPSGSTESPAPGSGSGATPAPGSGSGATPAPAPASAPASAPGTTPALDPAASLAPVEDREWHGRLVPYDLVREAVIALTAMTALAVLLAILFSSPDARPSTIGQWSRADPADFVTTAVGELSGSSGVAGYGPPYNHTKGASQKIGPIKIEQWLGVTHPIDTARDFVIRPLQSIPNDPTLRRELAAYQSAPANQQSAWTDAYTKALPKATVSGQALTVPAGSYGPVAPMMNSLLALAQSNGLDGALLTSSHFYQTDYTKPLLFMSDGGVLSDRAKSEHLLGTQWGMMNETGSYPGQVWLWLYTFWYQIEPFKSSHNADALVWTVMAVLTLILICVPFIPGLRSIPRVIPVYRLIWRHHYREVESRSPSRT